ncbi:MAG: hypothetical protein JW854_03200 [Actinobacteria bacterium]|nr:hypothetical protein [Actinomycetota bacterium]
MEENLAQIEQSLAGTEARLAELGLAAKQEAISATSARITEEMEEVSAAASSLDAGNPHTLTALGEAIEGMTTTSPPTILGSGPSRRLEPEQKSPPVIGTSIAPAYLAGTPGLEPSSLPTEPGEEDLAETPEAPHTEEIVSLASELGNDPVRIYE